ncbi:response regulator [bacterium]|nr:response regulator [bacterium]
MEKFNVMIVEDDFRVSNIWKEFTHTLPEFQVVFEARNGEDALNYLKEKPVDLLIMDVYMPDVDGVQMLYEIRKQGLSIDVIAITAAREPQVVSRMVRMGVLDYIIKPCVLERYQQALTRFKETHEILKKGELEQKDLDRLLHWSYTSQNESRRLPKGMQELTMKKILHCFDQNPYARSAEELAKSTGLSLATVQRYLRYLAESGKVKKELIYGSQGRPEHKYSKI